MSEDKKDNMKLWEQVCVTDPAITKHVGTRGGFTAIDAQAQVKRATELWGSYGWKWGVRHCKYSYVTEGEERIVLEATLKADFFYPIGEKDEAVIEIATDIAYKKGNDTCKKLLTDLRSKALSLIGMNSDVFEGKFDDNKYVAGLKNGDQPAPITKTQLKSILQLMNETETDPNDDKFILYLKNNFAVVEIINLSEQQARRMEATLQAKLDKQNA